MKLVISMAILGLLAAAPGYAQQEQDKEKEQQQEQKAQEEHRAQDKTQEKQETEKEKQESAKQQEDARKAQDKQQKNETDKQRETRDQDQKASALNSRHEADNHARRIPDDRYRANFGAHHKFHVERRDDRRIQYGGYQFEYTAWPAGWAYNDDFYIEDIDGQYYLIDAVHPERRIVVVLIG
jgi:DNA mismatch repair ATPase MutL